MLGRYDDQYANKGPLLAASRRDQTAGISLRLGTSPRHHNNGSNSRKRGDRNAGACIRGKCAGIYSCAIKRLSRICVGV
jgi:hypothetical protein